LFRDEVKAPAKGAPKGGRGAPKAPAKTVAVEIEEGRLVARLVPVLLCMCIFLFDLLLLWQEFVGADILTLAALKIAKEIAGPVTGEGIAWFRDTDGRKCAVFNGYSTDVTAFYAQMEGRGGVRELFKGPVFPDSDHRHALVSGRISIHRPYVVVFRGVA
jgi:hypothetical protein